MRKAYSLPSAWQMRATISSKKTGATEIAPVQFAPGVARLLGFGGFLFRLVEFAHMLLELRRPVRRDLLDRRFRGGLLRGLESLRELLRLAVDELEELLVELLAGF